MASTRINPGAFRTRSAHGGVGAIARRFVRDVRAGRFRVAAVSALASSLNLVEVRWGNEMPVRYRCTCCGHTAHGFWHVIAGERVVWNSACPQCDSRGRHRGLAILLPKLIADRAPRRVLHFAPEPVLRRCFEQPGMTYETADLYLEDVTHRGIDLQQLPFADATYDLVVCNHVLEHLPDDDRALREIARIVRGSVVLTVPGDFGRRDTLHFAGELPNGHYRDYGGDFIDRLRTVFSAVEVVDLHAFDRDTSGLSRGIRPRDLAFLCEP